MCRHPGIRVRCKAFPDTSRISWRPLAKAQSDTLGHFEGCLEPAGGCSETFLETSGTLWDASGGFQSIPGRLGTISSRQQSCQNPPRGIGSTKLVFFVTLERPGNAWKTFLEAFRMLQDALGHSWRHPVRSWTLWDASGSLQDTLGGLKHYACSVFCGLRMPPGRPRTLKHYACSVFWDGEGLQPWQGLARRTPPNRIFLLFFII